MGPQSGFEFNVDSGHRLISPTQENTFRPNSNGQHGGHTLPHIPVQHPRKGTCSNIWQVGAVMNILLIGKKIHFNTRESDSQRTLDRCNCYFPGIGFGFNHGIGLNDPDCINHYSGRLRELVKHCLLREPLARPSSKQLVKLTTEGLEYTYSAISGVLTTIPPGIASRNIPFLTNPRPQPPMEWAGEISDLEMDWIDVELPITNVPKEQKNVRGLFDPLREIRLPLINSILAPGSSQSK